LRILSADEKRKYMLLQVSLQIHAGS
jgi:hypothetical protein